MSKNLKILCSSMMILIIGFTCSGCKEDPLEGIWYSDRIGCDEVLLLQEDHRYHYAGETGIYQTDGTCLILAGDDLFGEQILKIEDGEEGEKQFSFNLQDGEEILETIRFFPDLNLAEESREEKEAKKQEEENERLEQEIRQAEVMLLGVWSCKKGKTQLSMEFQEGGVLIASEKNKRNTETIQMTYQIKDGSTLVLSEMGKEVEKKFSIETKEGQTHLTINQIGNEMVTYVKSR